MRTFILINGEELEDGEEYPSWQAEIGAIVEFEGAKYIFEKKERKLIREGKRTSSIEYIYLTKI